MLQPSIVYTEAESPSLKALVTDPYIIIAAGKYFQMNRKIFILEKKKLNQEIN